MAMEQKKFDIGLTTHGQMLVELADMMHECGGEPFCIDDALISSWNERLFGGSRGASAALGRLQREKLLAHDGSTAGGVPLYSVTATGRDAADAARRELATLRMDRAMCDAFEACDEIAAEQDAQSRRTGAATAAALQRNEAALWFDEATRQARELRGADAAEAAQLKSIDELHGVVFSRVEGEAIIIGIGPDAVYVKLCAVKGPRARIMIDAPRSVPVDRHEVRRSMIANGVNSADRVDSRADSRAYEPTQTADEAFARIMQARLGSLAGRPTPIYLAALREQLYKWIGQVEDAMRG